MVRTRIIKQGYQYTNKKVLRASLTNAVISFELAILTYKICVINLQTYGTDHGCLQPPVSICNTLSSTLNCSFNTFST